MNHTETNRVSPPEDKQRFTELCKVRNLEFAIFILFDFLNLKQLRDKFDEEATLTGSPRLILSVAFGKLILC